ncbi:hypothetical protein ACFJGX_10030 [Hydrogenophaga sp. UC242_50]|uniref:hypothetical protein n=1 Tax=unclassified Hydrogenophaga TaxID=2610897 RepID=UPI0036D3FF0E
MCRSSMRQPVSRRPAPLSHSTRPPASMPARASIGVPSSVGLAWKCSTRCSTDCNCSRRFSIVVAYMPTTDAASNWKRPASIDTSSTPAS